MLLRAEFSRMGEHRLYRRRWYILLLFATMSMYQGEQHFKASYSILKSFICQTAMSNQRGVEFRIGTLISEGGRFI
jgi:hypothetical protein